MCLKAICGLAFRLRSVALAQILSHLSVVLVRSHFRMRLACLERDFRMRRACLERAGTDWPVRTCSAWMN